MKDINDITLCNGDMVLFTRKEYGTLLYGIVYNDSIVSKFSIHKNLIQIYKIIQLSNKEKNIKTELLNKIKKIEEVNTARKKLKFLSAKSQVIGNSYCTLSGDIFLYIGKCTVHKKDAYKRCRINKDDNITDSSGYGYICIGYVNYDMNYDIKHEHYFRRPIMANSINHGYNTNTPVSITSNKKRFVCQCSYKTPVITNNFVYYGVDQAERPAGYSIIEIMK